MVVRNPYEPIRITIDDVKIEEIKTWFRWHTCSECGKEYRREVIWKLSFHYHDKAYLLAANPRYCYNPYNNEVYCSYICKHCCPTQDEVKQVFNKWLKCDGFYSFWVWERKPK